MSTLLQQLANGLVLGGTIAMIALGYTLVYGIIQLINFAHGEIFMVGAYGGLATFTWILPAAAKEDWFVVLPLVLLGGIAVSVVIAVLTERFAYRPLRNAPRLAPLITALGVSLVLQEVVRVFYPGAEKSLSFPKVFPSGGLTIPVGPDDPATGFRDNAIVIPYTGVLIIGVAIVLSILVQTYVSKSRMGRAMQATSADRDTARLMGVNPDRTIVITFVLGGLLAGVAGVLFGSHLGNINIDMGFLNGIFAFTAAVLGGIGSIKGAVIGGFCIGLVKSLSGQYFPGGTQYDLVWIFVVLILVLVFRPQGFFGDPERVRA